jgi:hypothetical protein
MAIRDEMVAAVRAALKSRGVADEDEIERFVDMIEAVKPFLLEEAAQPAAALLGVRAVLFTAPLPEQQGQALAPLFQAEVDKLGGAP